MQAGLLSAAGLGGRLADSGKGLIVIDLRQDPWDGRPKIPGSVWAHLHQGFAQPRPDRNLAYDLPSAEEFAAALSRLGVDPESEIVVADDSGNRWATRVFWLLRYYGHRGATFVLDGGIAAYLRSGLATASEFASAAVSEYPVPATRDESIRATAEEILEGLSGGALTLCDTRTPQEFSGDVAMSGRGGHLPGAVLVPWESALADDGTFLPRARLADMLAPYLKGDSRPITYCQGGIRASLTWFALEVLLGHPARLYAASWEEWAQRAELPVELSA